MREIRGAFSDGTEVRYICDSKDYLGFLRDIAQLRGASLARFVVSAEYKGIKKCAPRPKANRTQTKIDYLQFSRKADRCQ